MREATARCLRDAYCTDSMAQVRYLLYAEKAGEEGFPSIARMFVAMAQSRYTRASEEYRLVAELIGTRAAGTETYFTLARTMDNMERAREAEAGDADDMLPAYAALAGGQGEGAAARSFERSAVVCRHRAALLEDVIRKTRHAEEEPLIERLHVCRACGYITIGEAPGGCPVCGNGPAGFIVVA